MGGREKGETPGCCGFQHAEAASNLPWKQDWSLFEMKQDDVTSHKAGPVPPDFLKKLSPERPGATSTSPEGEFSKCVPFLLALVLKGQK